MPEFSHDKFAIDLISEVPAIRSELSCGSKHKEPIAEPEISYWCPHQWIEEYKRTGTVQRWHDDYPYLITGRRGISGEPKPDDKLWNFSTYALMYLLRRDEVIESLTYFRLAAKSKSVDIQALQGHLRTWMGNELFERLRTAIREAKLTGQGFEGEPDLFCWDPSNGSWFFAEAKGTDKLMDSQRRWFAVCRAIIPEVTIKVCRVRALSGMTEPDAQRS